MGDKMRPDFAKEAKDLLDGKEDSLLDIQPYKKNQKYVKMIMRVPKRSVIPSEISKLQRIVAATCNAQIGYYEYSKDSKQKVLILLMAGIPDSAIEHIKDFYNWVVK
jgi:hypothetical protein